MDINSCFSTVQTTSTLTCPLFHGIMIIQTGGYHRLELQDIQKISRIAHETEKWKI
ncbi:MAG: hypothetical protein GY749_19750 [Desulfobacteraceae bacterium]|nr:hypothetical protein [Desulfobacteraceae bacterium]